MASTSRSSLARWAAQRACVTGSPSSLARESASEEAGRWLTFASRSSLARTSRAAGRRNRRSGERAAPRPSANRMTPPMRTARGANCQAPAQEAARNRIDDGEREDERRPDALDQKRASRPNRERREPSVVDRWVVRVLHRDAVIRRWRFEIVRYCLRRKFQANCLARLRDNSRHRKPHFNQGGSVSRPINSS